MTRHCELFGTALMPSSAHCLSFVDIDRFAGFPQSTTSSKGTMEHSNSSWPCQRRAGLAVEPSSKRIPAPWCVDWWASRRLRPTSEATMRRMRTSDGTQMSKPHLHATLIQYRMELQVNKRSPKLGDKWGTKWLYTHLFWLWFASCQTGLKNACPMIRV